MKAYNRVNMKNTRLFRSVVCIVILINLFSIPTTVYACSCIVPGPPSEAFSQYDAIFIGKVIGTTYLTNTILRLSDFGLYKIGLISSIYDRNVKRYHGYDVTFEVSKSWKLVKNTLVKVFTGYGGGDCGYSFITGNEYLVYASYAYGEPGNYLVTSICGRNAELSDAEEDLAYLNSLVSVKLSLAPSQILSAGIFISFVALASLIYLRNKNKKT